MVFTNRPVAMVTGAARRIGREIALELAAAGHDVALHCRHSQAEAQATADAIRALGVRALVIVADLADEQQCRALLPAVVEAFGRVDLVVNNASTFEYDQADSFTYATLDRHCRANVAPAVVLAQALHAHLRAAGDGRSGCVVNLLDQKLWNLNPDHLSYTLSKAALQTATVMLAQGLAPTVRVCGVAPGVTLLSGQMTDEEFAHAHTMTPLRRSSSPADVARAVRFLAESPAITGTTVVVDGGQHLTSQTRDVQFLVRGAAT